MLQSSFGIDHIHLVPTLRETIPAIFFLALRGDARQQILGGYLVVSVEPTETVLVTEIEGKGLSFGSEGRFIVNDDTDIFVLP